MHLEENDDGTFTYWGATGDFGRQAIDVYRVTLPAPAQSATQTGPDGTDEGDDTSADGGGDGRRALPATGGGAPIGVALTGIAVALIGLRHRSEAVPGA